MASTPDLNEKQRIAMTLAEQKGAVFPGYNELRGKNYKVNVSTIQALVRRDLLTTRLSPDGGMMGVPVRR